MTVEIFFCDFQSIVNGVFEFLFFKSDVQFSVELFFCCSTVDCLHLDFIVLLWMFGNGMGKTRWEFHGNGNKTKFGNGNGRNGSVKIHSRSSVVWARGRCRISPPCFLAECCKRQLSQVSFVVLYFRLSTYSDLY